MAAALLDRLAIKIEAETGLAFSGARRRDLDSAFKRIAKARGVDLKTCADWLLEENWDKSKGDACAPHLTIGETYFFREPRAFDLLCDYARSKIGAAAVTGRKLRIWSAGCCTGEEAYSIAMVLCHKVPGLRVNDISVLATDLNSRNLESARAGVYRQWSFRNSYLPELRNYLSTEGENQHCVRSHIKKLVRFEELNLATGHYPSATTATEAMDIIFCRNVLMYFSKAKARSVIARFRECLVDGGWLIVSPSEASSELFPGFLSVLHEDAIFFQKIAYRNGEPMVRDARAIASASGEVNPLPAATTSPARRNNRAPAVGPGVSPTFVRERTRRAPAGEVEKREPVTTSKPGADGATASNSGIATAEDFHAKAMLAAEAGNHAEAIRHLKRAIYLQPDFIVAHYLVGVLQFEQNKRAQAMPSLKTAGELLAQLRDEDIVPASGGLPVAYLRDSVRTYLAKGGR
jgi:chemotaxis protein methyltransferase CheR